MPDGDAGPMDVKSYEDDVDDGTEKTAEDDRIDFKNRLSREAKDKAYTAKIIGKPMADAMMPLAMNHVQAAAALQDDRVRCQQRQLAAYQHHGKLPPRYFVSHVALPPPSHGDRARNAVLWTDLVDTYLYSWAGEVEQNVRFGIGRLDAAEDCLRKRFACW